MLRFSPRRGINSFVKHDNTAVQPRNLEEIVVLADTQSASLFPAIPSLDRHQARNYRPALTRKMHMTVLTAVRKVVKGSAHPRLHIIRSSVAVTFYQSCLGCDHDYSRCIDHDV